MNHLRARAIRRNDKVRQQLRHQRKIARIAMILSRDEEVREWLRACAINDGRGVPDEPCPPSTT